MKKFEAAIFDIDGTLTFENSWLTLIKSVDEHFTINREFKENKISYEESKRQILKLLKKGGKANKHFLINFFRDWPLRKEAKEVISFLKEKEYLVCLITGSVDLYAKIIAERLGVNYYFANTELIWDKKEELIDYHYYTNQGKKKLEQFLEFCKKQRLNPKNCLIVGDDTNDIELFQHTKNGIALRSKTSHYLEPFAWKTIDNLLDLKKIII